MFEKFDIPAEPELKIRYSFDVIGLVNFCPYGRHVCVQVTMSTPASSHISITDDFWVVGKSGDTDKEAWRVGEGGGIDSAEKLHPDKLWKSPCSTAILTPWYSIFMKLGRLPSCEL